MDFYKIKTRVVKKNGEVFVEVYPDFVVGRTKDLMVQGKSFYAVWDREQDLWSTDEYDVQRLVDQDLRRFVEEHPQLQSQGIVDIKLMSDFSSNSWKNFRNYISNISDSAHPLDDRVTFANESTKRTDYISKKLPYPLDTGECPAYNELLETIYEPEELDKLEWAIGSIFTGDSKYIQKFIVLYGEAGAGKSTFLNILQQLFEGYYTTFEAKALTGSSNSFAMEVFRSNPLVAIQHDGDLSRIEDNTKLNSIVSHEEMTMNEKYKASYMIRLNAFLFMGTNKPVKITDAKSGIIRRLIDVQPSGNKVSADRYHILMSQIGFELGAIANKCINKYLSMGRNYYAQYRPVEMILQTDVFFNFIENYFDIFKEQNGATLSQAYDLYKIYCEDSHVEFKLPRYRFREEFKNYFQHFYERKRVNGVEVRSYYEGFLTDKFLSGSVVDIPSSIDLSHNVSLLDDILSDSPAQYANEVGTPTRRWADVDTILDDIDTSKTHYVKLPKQHIVIDFDIRDGDEKSLEKNLQAAAKWPPTYSEVSKSGNGVHLHYIYDGDVDSLSPKYSEGIEVKTYPGNSALRRKVTLCNDLPIATISSGLPQKEKKVIDVDKMTSEKGVRDLIRRNLNKEIHPSTKPSVDFIFKILTDAKESGMEYDVRDLRPAVLNFALSSTNQAPACLKLVSEMPFYSGEEEVTEFDVVEEDVKPAVADDDRIVFFDVEVYPNLFYISWKFEGEGKQLVHMFNPSPEEVEQLMKMKLVGFNNRKYDNHMLYARFMGYNNEQLFKLSERIISNQSRNASFAQAYGLSYADIYDFSSKKQSLKKFEIELGIPHIELPFPWDEPVPEDKWNIVAEYCDNDVLATEAVWNARQQDLAARKVLAQLSGLRINDTTRAHVSKIIFGNNRRPQSKFVYTDLSETFPGYKYEYGKSTYKGEVTGEGGYVYAEPGMYEDVVVLDVASMHPTSIEELNLFGPYTKTFSDLKQARLAVKHQKYDEAASYLNGALKPYLKDPKDAKDLSEALKIVINSVYGLTSARFDNPFKDKRNVDNIVAKRGALFMIDLKEEVQKRGYTVAHIKTDSIKIPGATPEIIDFVIDYGKKYGYDFEIEDVYSKMCLVNDAVYVAHVKPTKPDEDPYWKAIGAQFKHPYVFKTLFSHEEIIFEDLCETKSVTTALYLKMDENSEDPDDPEDYRFVGRVGSFCPMRKNTGGGILLRKKGDDYHAVSGTKGYRWLEAETVKELDLIDDIDLTYFNELVTKAVETIEEFGSYSWLVGKN